MQCSVCVCVCVSFWFCISEIPKATSTPNYHENEHWPSSLTLLIRSNVTLSLYLSLFCPLSVRLSGCPRVVIKELNQAQKKLKKNSPTQMSISGHHFKVNRNGLCSEYICVCTYVMQVYVKHIYICVCLLSTELLTWLCAWLCKIPNKNLNN